MKETKKKKGTTVGEEQERRMQQKRISRRVAIAAEMKEEFRVKQQKVCGT